MCNINFVRMRVALNQSMLEILHGVHQMSTTVVQQSRSGLRLYIRWSRRPASVSRPLSIITMSATNGNVSPYQDTGGWTARTLTIGGSYDSSGVASHPCVHYSVQKNVIECRYIPTYIMYLHLRSSDVWCITNVCLSAFFYRKLILITVPKSRND